MKAQKLHFSYFQKCVQKWTVLYTKFRVVGVIGPITVRQGGPEKRVQEHRNDL